VNVLAYIVQTEYGTVSSMMFPLRKLYTEQMLVWLLRNHANTQTVKRS